MIENFKFTIKKTVKIKHKLKKSKISPKLKKQNNFLSTRYAKKFVGLFLYPSSFRYLFISKLFKKKLLVRLSTMI